MLHKEHLHGFAQHALPYVPLITYKMGRQRETGTQVGGFTAHTFNHMQSAQQTLYTPFGPQASSRPTKSTPCRGVGWEPGSLSYLFHRNLWGPLALQPLLLAGVQQEPPLSS